ncbi:carbohydrate-binding domain-containing protein [Streptomyces marispadix]|uniref:Carbohydrate-binding domain-containing protein n=1 Tax=Streptomyces marispadix TaxID=2922868 RepID=A0ABS9SYR2_9ACTN|nr:carbohydrate-binding domain-containing protein [Streptomyces marispadix]MCH6161416.1 carbohydrate-binding domain-containing protein [Streptomyces marispadix]
MKTAFRRGGLSAAVGLTLGLALLPAQQAQAATSVPCNDIPALKAAINQANTTGESITLASGCTYTLTTPDNDENGLPVVTGNVRISSNGATIRRASSAADDFRIFEVADGGSLTLNRINITGGKVDENSGGGGILSRGPLTLNGGTVSNNTAGFGGGLRHQQGLLTLSQAIVENNHAIEGSGGIHLAGGTMAMTSGALRNNVSDDNSGGLLSDQGTSASLIGTTVSGNTAVTTGGGLDTFETALLRITSSTISNNRAETGGGLYNDDSTAALSTTRVTSNTATGGPGSGGGIRENSGEVTLAGGSVTGNTPENCAPPGSIPGCTG